VAKSDLHFIVDLLLDLATTRAGIAMKPQSAAVETDWGNHAGEAGKRRQEEQASEQREWSCAQTIPGILAGTPFRLRIARQGYVSNLRIESTRLHGPSQEIPALCVMQRPSTVTVL
jgi:hypothetical protein